MSDKKCCIVFNEAREHTLTAGPKDILRLIPGKNIVSMAVVDKVSKGNKEYQTMIDNGMLEVLPSEAVRTDPETGNGAVDITQLSGKEVKDLVSSEVSLDTLQEYLATEEQHGNRENVKGVIQKQIDVIQAAEAAEKE